MRSSGPIRRGVAAALTVVGVCTATLVAAAPAQADDPPIVYSALGDSLSAGAGALLALPYDLNLLCTRNTGSYPVLWVNNHDVSSFDFAACSGATTVDVINNQLGGLSSATTLVTVTAGANDFASVQAIFTCHTQSDAACENAWEDLSDAYTADLGDLLDAMLAAITTAAPNAEVVLMGPPGLFALSSGCGLLGLSLAKRTAIADAGAVFRGISSARASANGAVYGDAVPAFNGHRICNTSPWIHDLSGLVFAYHPDDDGYRYGYLPTLEAITG
ncbi:MAG: SGNH/GDSL hydrolase family protein [Actinophytocola sp.]|uniref:SGNH/GDSL hydrolase family protein n=1 Tax=Actinophytocola sp. TaxID=1872138 RepID=UPI003C776041